MKGCVNRVATLKEDSWKVGCGALEFKVSLVAAPVREALGCTGTSQHPLGCSFPWEWALGFSGKGIEEPCSSSLGWAVLYFYSIWFSKQCEADVSVNRTKPVYSHLVRAPFLLVLWFPSCCPFQRCCWKVNCELFLISQEFCLVV